MSKRPPARLLSILSLAALPLLAALLGTGCASFVKFSAEGTGTANTFVRVNSIPQGIQGTLNTGRSFTTPANLVLRSDQEYTITFTKEGSEPIVVNLEPEMNNWVCANILTLGIGCFFDAEKGSNITLSPDDILVTFEKETPSSEPETTESTSA